MISMNVTNTKRNGRPSEMCNSLDDYFDQINPSKNHVRTIHETLSDVSSDHSRKSNQALRIPRKSRSACQQTSEAALGQPRTIVSANHQTPSNQALEQTPKEIVCLYRRPYTKQELARALPRRSFFSCHENALREAKLTRKLTEKLNRNRGESAPISRGRPTIKPLNSTLHMLDSDRINTNFKECLDTSNGVDFFKGTQPTIDNIEPLFKYLEYVKANQEEFLRYLQSKKLVADDTQSSIIKLGHAFELRHHGGQIQRSFDDLDVVVMAAKILNHRTSLRASATSRTDKMWRSGLLPDNSQSFVEKISRDESTPMTELEKRLLRAEEWATTVSTYALNRIKQQVLKDLGYGDHDLEMWWQPLQTCQYLRSGPSS
ncbi:protein starmaker [Biomphalaria glabrata]|nr:protein starmaker [Biomphalaria glabrata]